MAFIAAVYIRAQAIQIHDQAFRNPARINRDKEYTRILCDVRINCNCASAL